MIIEFDVSSTKELKVSIPHGRTYRILRVRIRDISGSSNAITITDEGNYYDGSNFSNTFSRTIASETVPADGEVVIDFTKIKRFAYNNIYAIGTSGAKVVIDAEPV